MGLSESRAEDEQERKAFLEKYRLVEMKVSDRKYGEYDLYEEQSAQKGPARARVVVKTFDLGSKEACIELRRLIEKRLQLRPENLGRMVGVVDTSEPSFCGQFHRMSTIYEMEKFDLEADIACKEKLPAHNPAKVAFREQYYREEELWFILESLLKGLAELATLGRSHGDVQPRTVGVGEEGQIRLSDFTAFDPVTDSGYLRMVTDRQATSPVSPQLLSGLLARHPQPAYDREKNDVWGLGITMICAAAVCSYLEFYDFANGLLNTDAIHQRLESLARLGYSSYFVKCVSNMVNMNEEYRPSLRDIQKFLGPLQHSQPAYPR